ncbi:MAG TPA: DEAD/DEAH box helicase family protein [Spirillospora sp.]|nr:DEAD/DEAH box helicase family protein [Spirillospora sp.]
MRHRPDELANGEFFASALRTALEDGRLIGYHRGPDGTVMSDHGLHPQEHADRLLRRLRGLYRAKRTPPGPPGRYRTTLRVFRNGAEPTTTRAFYNLTDLRAPAAPPLEVPDAPRLDEVVFEAAELRKTAERIDTVRGEEHRARRIDDLMTALTGPDGDSGALRIDAGGLTKILQAPTGFGKSVLLEIVGTLAAERGLPTALVVPTRAAALRLAHRVETNLSLLGIDATCTPLLSPARLMEDARKAAVDDSDGFGAWAYERLGYGCALAAAAETDGEVDAWRPGEEPCKDLRETGGGRESGSPHACPWLNGCGKYRLMREAVHADVIVTAHQTFFTGRMHIPLRTSGGTAPGTSDRLGVEEFLLRRCALIAIDELDQFQAAVIARSARHLVLADGPHDTPLKTLDDEFHHAFGKMPPEIDGEVRAILSDLKLLSMGYVAALAHGWLPPVRAYRPGWRTGHWIVPRRHDAWITARLLGIAPDGRAVDDGETRALQLLYTGAVEEAARALRLAGVPGKEQEAALGRVSGILRAVSGGCRDAILPVHLAELARVLEPVVADQRERGDLTARMIRRAYLEPLRSRLQELFVHTSHLRAVGAESAERIADALGGLTNWTAMPGSPLGRLFLAFMERHEPGVSEGAKLSMAAFGGDPHGYVLHLGELTARAHAGVPRAVLGLSATSYFPGAPHHHVHTRPTWYVPDADPTGVRVLATRAFTGDGEAIRVSGVQGRQRRLNLRDLGGSLYRATLVPELDRLAARRDGTGEPGRDLILVATTSYASCLDLAEGMAQAGAPPGSLCVVARADDEPMMTDSRWSTLTRGRVEGFPATGARILIAPLATVERGVNILDGSVSALGAIYLVVRPIPIIDEPAELLAHVNHRLWAEQGDADDPVLLLRRRISRAGRHFDSVVRSAQYFRSQPAWVQHGVVAEIIVGLVQLVGRARRGGTPGRVHLVDNAFFDTRGGSDLPRLIRDLRDRWDGSGELDHLLRLYGPTLRAFFDFADRNMSGSSPEE